ncbi:MAG: hypothetical protein ABI175_06560, partial [Polyangiales bacterium]
MKHLACIALIGALGCNRGDDGVGRDPATTKAVDTSTSAPATASTTTTAAATTSAPATVASVELPAIDAHC